MRTAVYYNNDDVRIEERPVPKIGTGEILVKVTASGICGSDVMFWYRANKVPLVLGHEIAGEITAIGEGVKNYKAGDRISASHHVPCNTCHYCLNGHHTACDTLRQTNFDPGGFAEYLRLSPIHVDRGISPLPAEVSNDEATFIEPLACVVRSFKKTGFTAGQSVLIIGCGLAGMLHVNLAKALGAGMVAAADINDFRLNMAKQFGADLVLNAKDDLSAKIQADVVIVCAGAEAAINQGLKCAARGGIVMLFAPTDQGRNIQLPANDFFWRNDRTITTTYAGSPADHFTALELIRRKRVKVAEMITHRLPLSEIGKGFQLVSKAKDSLKVIVEPQK